jgi:hypothetical protein
VLTSIVTRCGAQLVVDETIGPGVFVAAGDDSVVVDNTLAARLARSESRLTIELARRLRDPAAAVASAD